MSRTWLHAHAWLRQRQNLKDRSWRRYAQRYRAYQYEALDGELEYIDVAARSGKLNYMMTPWRHEHEARYRTHPKGYRRRRSVAAALPVFADARIQYIQDRLEAFRALTSGRLGKAVTLL